MLVQRNTNLRFIYAGDSTQRGSCCRKPDVTQPMSAFGNLEDREAIPEADPRKIEMAPMPKPALPADKTGASHPGKARHVYKTVWHPTGESPLQPGEKIGKDDRDHKLTHRSAG